MLERSFQKRERLCIHRSHACSCTSLALIVVHSSLTLASALRSSSLLFAPSLHKPCTHRPSSSLTLASALRSSTLSCYRECLAFIVAHRRSSSSLIHAQARERLALIVALACNSPALVPHRRTSALMLSCVLRSSMLMLDARDALRSSSLMLAIALRSSSLMLATALRSSSLIVAHARNRPCNRLGPKT